jgi:hypothetical protein
VASVGADVQGHKRPLGCPLLPLLTFKVLRVCCSVEGVLGDPKTGQLARETSQVTLQSEVCGQRLAAMLGEGLFNPKAGHMGKAEVKASGKNREGQ